MGRGTITGESGKGQYTIETDYGSGIRDARVEYYTQVIAQKEAVIANLEPQLTYYEAQEAIANTNLQSAITTYAASEKTDADKDALQSAQYKLQLTKKNTRDVKQKLGFANLDLANAVSKKAELTGISLIKSDTVWCADYSEGLTGEVATIEINAQPQVTLIAPSAEPPVTGDGEMIDRRVQSGAQVYFNAALLPGWQKFQPTYRTGYLVSIDRANDTCEVNLDNAVSSEQSLGINQSDILSDVPIEYMNCNSGAFETGDDVVVKFTGQDWENPKVIGFKDNPRPCAPAYFMFLVEEHTGTLFSGDPPTVNGSPVEQTAVIADGIRTITNTHVNFPDGRIEYDSRDYTLQPDQYVIKGRIRFDVAAFRISYADPAEIFQWAAPQTTVEHGSYADVNVSLGSKDIVQPRSMRDYQYSTGSAEYGYYLEGTWYVITPSVPILLGPSIGTSPASQGAYNDLTYPEDFKNCVNFRLPNFSPPGSITIEIDGRPIRYVLDCYGFQPPTYKVVNGSPVWWQRAPLAYKTIPVADPPTDIFNTTTGTNTPRESEYEITASMPGPPFTGIVHADWVYYRLENVPSINDDQWDFGYYSPYNN